MSRPRLGDQDRGSTNWLYNRDPTRHGVALNVRPKAMWGTQDMLTPPSRAALTGEVSGRVEELAEPKTSFHKNVNRPFYEYSTGRDSQLCMVSEGAKDGICTARLGELARHKSMLPDHISKQLNRPSFVYSVGRESPIWKVSQTARQAEDRPLTTALSQARPAHPKFQPEREVQSAVTPAARQAKCTERLDQLATPRVRVVTMFRNPEWKVSDKCKKVHATGRTIELARSKNLADGYSYNHDWGVGYERMPQLIREVTVNARRATASNRTKELSLPIVRSSMDKVQFDPAAFIVKPAAMKAWCSSRLQELAEPLKR